MHDVCATVQQLMHTISLAVHNTEYNNALHIGFLDPRFNQTDSWTKCNLDFTVGEEKNQMTQKVGGVYRVHSTISYRVLASIVCYNW